MNKIILTFKLYIRLEGKVFTVIENGYSLTEAFNKVVDSYQGVGNIAYVSHFELHNREGK